MYNNPFNYYPYMNMGRQMGAMTATKATRPSLFKSLASIKWGNVLNNTQKTLNVINQAIPVYYQIKPIYSNLRSFGKIMNAFNDNSSNSNQRNETQNSSTSSIKGEIKKENRSSQPTFFIN